MGCGYSKKPPPSLSGSLASVRGPGDCRPGSKKPPATAHSPPALRFEVFGERYDDVPGAAVGLAINAKPKLPKSGVRRGAFHGPILPGHDGTTPRKGGVTPGHDGTTPRKGGVTPGHDGITPRKEGVTPGRDASSSCAKGNNHLGVVDSKSKGGDDISIDIRPNVVESSEAPVDPGVEVITPRKSAVHSSEDVVSSSSGVEERVVNNTAHLDLANISGYSLGSLSDPDEDENKDNIVSTSDSHFKFKDGVSITNTDTMRPEFQNGTLVDFGEEDDIFDVDSEEGEDIFEEDNSFLNVSKQNASFCSRAGSAKPGSVLTMAALNASFVTTQDDDELLSITPHPEVDDSLTYRTSSATPNRKTPLRACSATPVRSSSMTPLRNSSSTPRMASITPLRSSSITPIRTSSLTPSSYPDNPTPSLAIQLNTNFGPIMEENEGGYTPRSTTTHGGYTPRSTTTHGDAMPTPRTTYLPREVLNHNKKVGWHEWSIYKGQVYDNNIVRAVMKPLMYQEREDRQLRREERESEWEEYKRLNSDGFESDEEMSVRSEDLIAEYDLELDASWDTNAVRFILSNSMDINTIQAYLPKCCIGVLEQSGTTRYWKDVKEDVKTVLTDLIREDMSGVIRKYAAEYLNLLQRWVKKYRDTLPAQIETTTKEREHDPNSDTFPLPKEVSDNPDCLRDWLETWTGLNTDLPEGGAWDKAEEVHIEEFDLGDTHEIYLDSLRGDFDPIPFDCEISGEAGWDVIEEDLIKEDVVTENQMCVIAERSVRTDLHDPCRMRKRRNTLLTYFVNRYEMDYTKVSHFLKWAVEMEQNEKDLLNLC